MATTTKRPPLKQTVGAQYICHSTGTGSEFVPEYSDDVEKTEVVKSVSISENRESTPVMASGKVYTNENTISSTEISVEVIAFSAVTRAIMRGDIVTPAGLIKKNSSPTRPYFAYGKVVKFSDNHYAYEWYPKCQLVANTDETKTKEESYSEQNETLTISAMPFNDEGDYSISVDSDNTMIEGMTEEKFFSKPILSDADLTEALKIVTPPTGGDA